MMSYLFISYVMCYIHDAEIDVLQTIIYLSLLCDVGALEVSKDDILWEQDKNLSSSGTSEAPQN